jgi:hypothetical protein
MLPAEIAEPRQSSSGARCLAAPSNGGEEREAELLGDYLVDLMSNVVSNRP